MACLITGPCTNIVIEFCNLQHGFLVHIAQVQTPIPLLTSRNYYTFRDISVVDYCLLPHHKLDLFSDFIVRRTQDMFQNTGLLGAIGGPHHILPDHNLLMWTLDISSHLPALSLTEQNGQSIPTAEFVKYNCSEIPETFMLNDSIVAQIQSCIQSIENTVYNQSVIDEEYEQFC